MGCIVKVIKRIRIIFERKSIECDALFDSGASVTVIGTKFFEKNFGRKWQILQKPIKVFWINGNSIEVSKFVQIFIQVDNLIFPETVFLLDEFVEKIIVNEKEIKIPQVIIGAGTMDKYGIILDPKEGIKTSAIML